MDFSSHLPNELWIVVFNNIDSLKTLWDCRLLSSTLGHISILCFYKLLISKKDILRFQLQLSSLHPDSELERWEIQFTESDPLVDVKSLPRIKFRPLEIQLGSKGFVKCLSDACSKIELINNTDNQDLDSAHELQSILTFLRKSCDSLQTIMPRGTTTAYETIFRRLFNSLESIDSKNKNSNMIPFLSSIWQLLDIITPARLRDAKFCIRDDCCDSGLSVKIKDGEQEYSFETLVKSTTASKECGWQNEKKEYWKERINLQLHKDISIETVWLKGSDEIGRILDIVLSISPEFLMRNSKDI